MRINAILFFLAMFLSAIAPASLNAADIAKYVEEQGPRTISLALRDMPIQQVFEMLSSQERVNIVLGKGVIGQVSVNMYDVSIKQAINAIADAAGYAVEVRDGTYRIIEKKDAAPETVRGNTQIRSFKVQYSNPKQVAEILSKHLSRYGKITPLLERSMLVVEDLPEFVERLHLILQEIDAQPKQILIEAKILEITLDKNETFGIDWTKILSADRANKIGATGLATRGIPGLFFQLVNKNVEVFLSALSAKGRVHTLSTPRLLALENQEASTVIGDRIGYRVTTTINLVTTESIQFLETGIILRVTPSVDGQGRILMRIHPEVSSGSVSAGIPSKKSTEVTTLLLASDGQSVLIGGLIKNSAGFRRTGVPILSDVPVIGRLFANTEEVGLSTETVVLITPHILQQPIGADEGETQKVDAVERILRRDLDGLPRKLEWPSDAD